jgi:hypothetical protein
MGVWLIVMVVLLSGAGLWYWRINDNRRTEREQIKATVSAYLHMKGVYETILKETAAGAVKSSPEERDALVRARLLAAYRRILTGKILKNYEAALKTYSIFSDDYQMLFSDLEKIDVKQMQLVKKGPKGYWCTVALVSNEIYNTDLFSPDLQTLIKDYKVVNYTQAQLKDAAGRFNRIKLEVNRNDTFKLTKTEAGWLIEGLEGEIEKSTLSVE